MVGGPRRRAPRGDGGVGTAYLPAGITGRRGSGRPVTGHCQPVAQPSGLRISGSGGGGGQTWRRPRSDRAAGAFVPSERTALEWPASSGTALVRVDFDEQNLLLESLARDHVSFPRLLHRPGGRYPRRAPGASEQAALRAPRDGGDTPDARGHHLFGRPESGRRDQRRRSPAMGSVIALGTLRRECWEPGTRVRIASDPGFLGCRDEIAAVLSA